MFLIDRQIFSIGEQLNNNKTGQNPKENMHNKTKIMKGTNSYTIRAKKQL